MRILITSVGSATSINLIKAFKMNNDYVVGVDINPFGYTAGSCLVDAFYKVNNAGREDYILNLLSIISREKIDLLIPIHDIEVFEVGRHINCFKCNCIIPDVETIKLIRDKFICSKKVQKIGVNVPEIIDCPDNDKAILRDRIGVGSKGIEIITDCKVSHLIDKRMQFLQRYIEGDEYTVDILADKQGMPIYIIPRKRIEVKSGVATKVRIEKDDQLIDNAKLILENIKLPGFSNIQFIKDKNGKSWFIEINGRFSGCGAATICACPDYLDDFKSIINNDIKAHEMNKNVKWNTVITRYYEECVYEDGVS